jgi:anti-sigma regulatory factor (Ser/Thr protein kinase)
VDVVEAVAGDVFLHRALCYRGAAEFRAAAGKFVRGGQARAEPVLIALSPGKVSWLRRELDGLELNGPDPDGPDPDGQGLHGGSTGVAFTDMTELGRNPARIIPAIRSFMDRYPGRRIRCLGEPVWPERSAAELREVARSEALVNAAFSGIPASLVCLYDRGSLAASVLDGVGCTHPALLSQGEARSSSSYLGPAGLPSGCDRPLDCPPATAARLTYQRDLRPVRSLVARLAHSARLPARRITDLVLAASEVAANTLRHTRADGTVHVWYDGNEILCQITDSGVIADRLAGYRRPADDVPGGKGLWLVHQLCDLVEVRSSTGGTTICLHMRLR